MAGLGRPSMNTETNTNFSFQAHLLSPVPRNILNCNDNNVSDYSYSVGYLSDIV